MKSNFKYVIINLSFLLVLFVFFINQIFHFISDGNDIENRSKVEKPELNIFKLDYFPSEYDAYYVDNFSLRNNFLSYYNRINKHIFNNHILSNNYIRGNDDYTFTLYRFKKNSRKFDTLHLEIIKKELEDRDSIYKANNAKFLLFVVPEKNSTCHDKLPGFFRSNTLSRTEHAIKYLKENSNLDVFYLNDILKEKNDSADIYLKYDTHWNNLGAYWAYYLISEKLRELYPAINTLKLSDYNIIDSIKGDGDIAKNLGMPLIDKQLIFHPKSKLPGEIIPSNEAYREPDIFYWGLETSAVNNKEYPTALIIRDSYTIQLLAYLQNTFEKGVYIWDKWIYKPRYEIVSDLKPDLVIYIMAEGNLEQFLPFEIKDKYVNLKWNE